MVGWVLRLEYSMDSIKGTAMAITIMPLRKIFITEVREGREIRDEIVKFYNQLVHHYSPP